MSLQEYYLRKIGVNIVYDKEKQHDFVAFIDFKEKNVCPEFDAHLVINGECEDVTKTQVEKIFSYVFGYDSFVDTDNYGVCVKKSEKQCAKSFTVMETPCEKQDGYVYQKFINNRIAIDRVRDYRFYFAWDEFVLIQRDKHIDGIFYGGKAEQTFLKVDWRKYFTQDEISKIISVKNLLGMDVGAVDVVRDYSENKVYFLDANNISGIPDFIKHAIEPDYMNIFKTELNKRL